MSAVVQAGRIPRMPSAPLFWSSRSGFVFAAAGSAIGLGNIWKFPSVAGTHGGGAFIAVYLLCIVFVAAPILVAEVLIGRHAQRPAVGALERFGGTAGRWIGGVGVLAGFLILSYYLVVAGWTLLYLLDALRGAVPVELDSARRHFSALRSDPGRNLSGLFAFIGLTAVVSAMGLTRGVERFSRWAMCSLLLIMVMLLVQAARMPSFGAGFDAAFSLRFDALSAGAWLEALGHSFFTLSLGMGAMLTYGSHMARRDDAVVASSAVVGLDTLVSLLACAVLFPVLIGAGLSLTGGPGLVFEAIPVALDQLPLGRAWTVLFFLLLALAALTSTVAIMEVLLAHLADRRGMTRSAALWVCVAALALAGMPSALSGTDGAFGERFVAWTAAWTGHGLTWFDAVDLLACRVLLPVCGLGVAVCVGWRAGPVVRERLFVSGTRLVKLYWLWIGLIRWCAPPAILLIFLHGLGVLRLSS